MPGDLNTDWAGLANFRVMNRPRQTLIVESDDGPCIMDHQSTPHLRMLPPQLLILRKLRQP